jgi:hypothetical protein
MAQRAVIGSCSPSPLPQACSNLPSNPAKADWPLPSQLLWRLLLGASRGDEPRAPLARPGQARPSSQSLVPIHDWFVEGFDTTDLKDAKMLLGELS